jgi:hypothetical protein
MPADARIAPPVSAGYPARFIIGHAIVPSITVFATPLPETAPSRYPAIVTVRPGPEPFPDFPIKAVVQSTKKRPAPLYSRIAPKIVNRMM